MARRPMISPPAPGGTVYAPGVDRKRAPVPEERTRTVRDALRAALRQGPADARDLSLAVGIRERDVAAHLEHLARSLRRTGEHLAMTPAACQACGYAFGTRERLARPSACPRCRSTWIAPPVFRIERDRR